MSKELWNGQTDGRMRLTIYLGGRETLLLNNNKKKNPKKNNANNAVAATNLPSSASSLTIVIIIQCCWNINTLFTFVIYIAKVQPNPICDRKSPLRRIKATFALCVARHRINMLTTFMRGKSPHKRLWIRLCGRTAMRRHKAGLSLYWW